MNDLFIYILMFLIFIVIFWIFLIFKFSKNKKLSKDNINFFKKNIEFINKINSKKEQIIDYDKIYHKILLELWYKWTFGEILKSKPFQINNLQNIWELHKLRNKLSHDLDIIDEKILSKKSQDFKNELFILLKNIS